MRLGTVPRWQQKPNIYLPTNHGKIPGGGEFSAALITELVEEGQAGRSPSRSIPRR